MSKLVFPNLLIGGHDPSGAGLQADIETCAALEIPCVSVITALTVQNTSRVVRAQPVEADLFRETLLTLCEEVDCRYVKIGLIPNRAIAETLADFLQLQKNWTVVFDPVLVAGSGGNLGVHEDGREIVRILAPFTSLITPNLNEAKRLTTQPDAESAACELIGDGCKAVLITDVEPSGAAVINRLFQSRGAIFECSVTRAQGTYHGTGCTLSSAITALLSQGDSLDRAVEFATRFTSESLVRAYDYGGAQRLPNRTKKK
ncbi:MAG: hydroxymethylpyrimidine/phosphomethylpyrimidine kinase [Pseudomonadota bacterium]